MTAQQDAQMSSLMTPYARKSVTTAHAIMTAECVYLAKIAKQENTDQQLSV